MTFKYFIEEYWHRECSRKVTGKNEKSQKTNELKAENTLRMCRKDKYNGKNQNY